MNSSAWPEQFRVQFRSGFYETIWADYEQSAASGSGTKQQ